MSGIKKIFVFAIITSLVFFKVVLDDVSAQERKNQNKQNVTSKSLTSEGYSIFQETMADMTWQEVEKAAEEGAVILLPTAVIEEHGPHMGCGVDTYLAYQACKLARRELGRRVHHKPTAFWSAGPWYRYCFQKFWYRRRFLTGTGHDYFRGAAHVCSGADFSHRNLLQQHRRLLGLSDERLLARSVAHDSDHYRWICRRHARQPSPETLQRKNAENCSGDHAVLPVLPVFQDRNLDITT